MLGFEFPDCYRPNTQWGRSWETLTNKCASGRLAEQTFIEPVLHTKCCGKAWREFIWPLAFSPQKWLLELNWPSGLGGEGTPLLSNRTNGISLPKSWEEPTRATVTASLSLFFLLFLPVCHPCMKKRNCYVQSPWDRKEGNTTLPSTKPIYC